MTLTLESLAAQHEGHQSAPETHNAVPTGDGRWLVRDVLWVHPGAEKATLDIQSAAVFRDTMTFTFEVAE